MYGQIYTLPFKSIEENDYLVVIEKDGFTGTSTELTGSTSPFTVETSLDSPLSTYRLSTATLKIFGGDYLQNLFTPNPQGVRVKLLKNGFVEWIGFVTNDVYSQDYSNIEFEYEIELVNPLSTLKYKKFNKTSDTITLYQLIIDAIKYTNSEIRKLYLSTSVTNELNQNIYELIFTVSDNYIDEQDEPMNYYEILEEIAKYLCLTITIDKDSVYFLDYTGISKGFNQYYEYTFDSSYNVIKTQNPVTLINSTTIQTLDYSGNSSTLQINSGKNKAKVTCSLYDIDKVLSKLDDEFSEYVSMKEIPVTVEENKKDVTYIGLIRYFRQPKYDFYHYANGDPANGSDIPVHTPLANNDLGAQFVKTTYYNIDDIPAKLSFVNEIQVKLTNSKYDAMIGKTLDITDKVFSMKSKDNISTFKDVWFCISLQFKRNWGSEFADVLEKTLKFDGDYTIYQRAMFRIGNYYWNGTEWTTTETQFRMPVRIKKNDLVFNNYKTLQNTNTFDKGLGDLEGYTFKAPDFPLTGECEFTLYPQERADYNSFSSDTNDYNPYIYYKDIQISYGIPNISSIYDDWKDQNSDIVYENVISDEYVEESDEVELKICTFPDNYTKLCYSATYSGNEFLKVVKYIPLDIIDKPEVVLINKIVNYYSTPKYQVNVPVINKQIYPYTLITDSNLAGKKFIYAGNEIDYEFEKNTITIIEI